MNNVPSVLFNEHKNGIIFIKYINLFEIVSNF